MRDEKLWQIDQNYDKYGGKNFKIKMRKSLSLKSFSY